MKFFKEFGAFIKRGNVMDMAIGMVIGAAFNKIVSSLVNDVVMPLIGVICKVNVSDLKHVLVDAVLDAETGEVITAAVTLNYGNFIQTVIDFLIIAFSVFVAMKVILRANRTFQEASGAVKSKLTEFKNEIVESTKKDEEKKEAETNDVESEESATESEDSKEA